MNLYFNHAFFVTMGSFLRLHQCDCHDEVLAGPASWSCMGEARGGLTTSKPIFVDPTGRV